MKKKEILQKPNTITKGSYLVYQKGLSKNYHYQEQQQTCNNNNKSIHPCKIGGIHILCSVVIVDTTFQGIQRHPFLCFLISFLLPV